MTEREAYDRLARSPADIVRKAGRLLAQGHSVLELARELAQPLEPPADEPFVTPSCPGFPPLLCELSPLPFRLFHRGAPLQGLSPHCVAVVGSRKASSYGLSWSRRLGAALARRGISVCSGLALGIDAAAHRGALDVVLQQQQAGEGQPVGVPVAVLGHGWQHAYPRQNLWLRQLLEEHGILLSEFPPAAPPSRWTFPQRNRIIAGMCQAVVVVEAGPRSGSLHTARFANEAGRDVWVVPNRPGTPNSAGVLALLQDGASPMLEIEDFVDRLRADLDRTYPFPTPAATPPTGLARELVPLLLALAQDESATPSQLCQLLDCSPSALAEGMAQLEILGVLRRQLHGGWDLCRWDLVEQELQFCREPNAQRVA